MNMRAEKKTKKRQFYESNILEITWIMVKMLSHGIQSKF